MCAECRRDDARTVGGDEWIGHDIKCVRFVAKRLKGRRNVLRPPDSQPCSFETERLSCGFDPVRLQHGFGISSVSKHRQSAEVGDRRAQEFKPLGNKVGLLDRYSGDVATGFGQALNKAATDPDQRPQQRR
jgi:hypothetical protein